MRDLRIEGNDVADIRSEAASSGGGIWGSKGQRVRVVRNTVAHCADLEIDFEGCIDCEAIGNDVTSSTSNVSLAVFFFSSGIRFAENRVVRREGGRVFGIFNAPQQFTETGACILESNDFRSPKAIAVLGAMSAFLSFFVRGNKLENVRIERVQYPVVQQEYSGNRLSFTVASQERFDGLYSQAGGSMLGYPTSNRVLENIILSSVPQPPGSRAIVVEDSDYNTNSQADITGNKTSGFSIDICYIAGSENRIEKTANIKNNVIKDVIEREESKSSEGMSTVLLSGNDRETDGRLTNYPDSIPNEGLWNTGQRIVFNPPLPDGSIGALCIETGTPGRWRKLMRGE